MAVRTAFRSDVDERHAEWCKILRSGPLDKQHRAGALVLDQGELFPVEAA